MWLVVVILVTLKSGHSTDLVLSIHRVSTSLQCFSRERKVKDFEAHTKRSANTAVHEYHRKL